MTKLLIALLPENLILIQISSDEVNLAYVKLTKDEALKMVETVKKLVDKI